MNLHESITQVTSATMNSWLTLFISIPNHLPTLAPVGFEATQESYHFIYTYLLDYIIIRKNP